MIGGCGPSISSNSPTSPLQVTMAVSEMEAERLFARIKEEGVNVFFVKTPIEFGMTGEL
jgi:hypothetical protein